MDAAIITGTTIALGQTIGAYQFFLPKLLDIRKASPVDATMRNDVRMGQLAAGAVSLSIGALLSWMMSSPLPVVVTIMIALINGGLYQYALQVTPEVSNG
jgi:hypothetical protein